MAKKLWEILHEEAENNQQNRVEVVRKANQQFNEYTSKNGTYDTTKHTTTIGDLKKAYKNSSNYNQFKKSLDNYYRNSENSLWNKIKTIATTSANGNNRFNNQSNVVKDNIGKIDTQKTIEKQANQNFENSNKIKQIQSRNKAYQQAKEELLKSSLSYKQTKLQNPNVSDEELLEIAQNNSDTLQKNLIKDIASKNGTERTTELKNISTSDKNPLLYDSDKFRKMNNSVLQYKTTKEAQETAEKINNDLENGKIGSSVGHILEALPQKTMEAVASPIYSTGSLLNLKLRTGTADQDLQDWKVISSKYDKTTANINNDTVKTASNVSGTIGYMVPSILASIVAPETNLGRITQGISVGGQSYIENLNDDASNKFQSAITGLGKGYASYAIEGITGGNILGKGSLDDLAVRTIASKTSNKAVKKIASTIYEVGGEVFEEEVENQTGYLIDKIVNDKGISLKDWLNEQEETVKNTVLSTLVLKVLGLGGNVYNDVENYNYNAETKKWINEAEKIIQKENLTIDLDRFKVNNNIKEVNNVLKQLQQENNTLNSQPQSTQNQQILPTQQVNQQENKVAQNGNMKSILPVQRYVYAKSDNVKVDNLRQDASKYWDNSEKTKNYITMLEKIIQDKDIDIRLDTNLTDSKGNIANGSYSNGVITINPNSTRAGEFIAVHELTHAIGTDQMRNIVQKYRESNAEFDRTVKSLLQNYNATELTEEALSDVSAQLFGNQEFINNVAQTNPNIFKKIYSEIKYLWHQFRGYKNQDQFIEDLYYKWTQAYNSSNKLNETSNYYIEPIANFNETEYNNIIEEKLTKKEYAILRSIINSDSNIKPGINYIEVTNGRYTVYYKGFDDFKVMSRKVDTDAGRINKRNDTTGRKARYSKTFEQSFGNERTTTSNDEISNINTQGTRERSGSDTSSSTNIENVKYSIQESENNSGSFFNSEDFKKYILPEIKERHQYENKNKITETIEELKKRKETLDIDTDEGWDNNFIINQKIKALENGYDTIYDYLIEHDINELKKDYKYNPKILTDKINRVKQTEKKQEKLQKEIEEATPIKRAQYEIIQKTNPMFDDEHVGIRSPADIKTFEEAIQDEGSFSWGDYTKEDAERDLKRNKVKIYSSYAIKNGVFVSTSYQQALDYAGGDRAQVHSKEISPNRVAWINGDEGQYASINAKYFIENQTWQSYLDKNYKATGTRTNLEDIKLPVKENSNKSSFNLPTKKDVQKNILPTQGEKINWNEIERPEGKIRKHYRSIIESPNTTKEAKVISKKMMGTDTYVPESNNKQLERADKRIEISGADSELNSLMSRAMTGGNIKADDIAVGERLIQYYSKIGDKTKLQDAIQATAMAGTTAGQTVQAMSLLNHQTPEGQAIWLQRSVEKMNDNLKKNRGDNAQQFNLKPEMVEKIVNSKNSEELANNLNEVYSELGQQVSKTTLQKIDAWRYFSMLANPRTHIRNMVGNTAMGKTQGIKNKIAGSIEGIASKINPNMERTHTVVPASKEVKDFAKNDIKNVADRLGLNENKYNPKTRLENSMRTFKSNVMENTLGKLFDLNGNLLEAEDAFGLKSAYKKALSEYMTANKLTPENITDTQLSKARNYAVEQAQEATFHQASNLATLINQLGNKNKFAKYTLDSILPFKKTPINVAKSGAEYSPVGLVKSIIYDSVQLRKGNITINKYIDNISKGLTGTGIALVGYSLAKSGILKASGSDDEDGEKFDEEIGNQTYSIKIGGNTYSLDWLAPTGIPLFIGAETYEIMQAQNEEKESSSDKDSSYNQAIETATNLMDAMANAMNPMTEMSMLSGLTSALKSYDQDSSQILASIGTNSIKSYVNQFVPTALGQIAKTTDEYERSTTSTKSGVLPKAIDTTKNQIMNKVPGLRQMLPIKTDIWGNDVKQSENKAQRAFENIIAPYTRKEISSDKVNLELSKLYKNIGESSVLPDTIEKTFTINTEKYRMTNEEYSKYKENYGKTSYKLLNELISSKDYKNMTNVQKQKAIESVYSYTKEANKIDYAKNNNLEVEESTLYTTMQALQANGGKQSEYLNYIGKTSEIKKDKEKNQILVNSNYTDKTKSIIYSNTTGEDDKLYNIALKNSSVDINEYLIYKIKDSNEEFSADKDKDGNSISGSSKKKIYNYVNNNIIGVENRLIILGSKYKLTNTERYKLTEYINKISSNNKEAISTFEYLSKNYVIKNGKVYYK